MLTRRSLIAASAFTGLTARLPIYAAQAYPVRTVKIVVPFPPGTPSEFVIRVTRGPPVRPVQATLHHRELTGRRGWNIGRRRGGNC